MSAEQVNSFTQDDIAQWVNLYAAPAVQFTVESFMLKPNTFIIIKVREFDSLPTICRKQMTQGGKEVLKRGAIYYRSNSKNESAPISSEEDMRELITLATKKGVDREIAHLRELGFILASSAIQDSALEYEREREGR